jgi:hypothetical protein
VFSLLGKQSVRIGRGGNYHTCKGGNFNDDYSANSDMLLLGNER